jgi:hypothetical protein
MDYLRLSVSPSNDSGIRFYKRHGLLEQMLTMECPLYLLKPMEEYLDSWRLK